MADEEQTTVPSEFDEYEYEMEGGEDFIVSEGLHGLEEEEEKEDEFSRLGESSDNPEQERRYYEYLALIKEIDCQNQTVEDIKSNVMVLCAKECKTRCEVKEIKRLRDCMEQENLKLQCLINKAMQLQNFGSRRRYQAVPIATTIDEDNMPPYVSCVPTSSPSWGKQPKQQHHQLPCDGTSSSEQQSICPAEKEKEDNTIRFICKALEKIKPTCPEDKKLIKEIKCLLCTQKKGKKQPPCGYPKSSRGRSSARSPGADKINALKEKICCMQSSINQLKKEITKQERLNNRAGKSYQIEFDCGKGAGSGDYQEDGPCEAPCEEEQDTVLVNCLGKLNTKTEQIEELKTNYCHLLTEYSKKEAMLKEMQDRMKGMCGSCGATGGKDTKGAEAAELQVLRTRCNDYKEEQVEFKCIMKEQSQQLEEYRNKYLVAQQKVEEQNVTLEKLNMNNKRIEKQINNEVKEIRAKFQEKLCELLHFPKLLENEQLKVAQACKEKEEIQGKLLLVCRELKALKDKEAAAENNPDCRPQLARCQLELNQMKTKLEQTEKQRDLYCEELQKVKDELDTLRSESAKIIARTKERTEQIRTQMHQQISRLEMELAQCRATACLSVSDREAVIREMQGQLNTLSYSFDAAQKQIKTLRNHIAYVSNENCMPVKQSCGGAGGH